jgi:Restriction endonuclease NotI
MQTTPLTAFNWRCRQWLLGMRFVRYVPYKGYGKLSMNLAFVHIESNQLTSRGPGMPRTNRGLAEVFGYPPELETAEAREARGGYICPFIGSRCVKKSQHRNHDPGIPFGACSVWHKGEADSEMQPYVVCPVRFTEQQRVFRDVQKLFSNEHVLQVQMIEELNLSEIGRIDQILVEVDPRDMSLHDFNILEIMACSTTGTGFVIEAFNKALRREPTTGRLSYGINYRQVLSRMAVQALSKIEACEQWGAHMVWAIQDTLYKYMSSSTMLDLPDFSVSILDGGNVENLPPLLLFVYRMEKSIEGKFSLVLSEVRGGTAAQFAEVMRPRRLPSRDSVVARLVAKIRAGESVPLSPATIVEIAKEIIDNEQE